MSEDVKACLGKLEQEYGPFHNQDFTQRSRVHDWKAYVPEELEEVWSNLTENEALLVMVMAEIQARAEEHD